MFFLQREEYQCVNSAKYSLLVDNQHKMFAGLLNVRTKRPVRTGIFFSILYIYMSFAGLGSVRIVKNCDRGLENAARGPGRYVLKNRFISNYMYLNWFSRSEIFVQSLNLHYKNNFYQSLGITRNPTSFAVNWVGESEEMRL